MKNKIIFTLRYVFPIACVYLRQARNMRARVSGLNLVGSELPVAEPMLKGPARLPAQPGHRIVRCQIYT
jgi:hypothetical protein